MKKFSIFNFQFSKQSLILAIVLVTLVAPIFVAGAADDITKSPPGFWPLVPCGLNIQPDNISKDVWDYTQPCNQCLLIMLFKNLIDLVVKGLVPILGTFFFILGGFMILAGADKPGRIGDGKKLMWSTAIGIVIILCSYLVANFILGTLASKEFLAEIEWNPTGVTISCKVSTLKDIVNNTSQPPNPGGGGPPAPQKFKCENNQCKADPAGTFSDGSCGGTCQQVPPPSGGTCTGASCTFSGRPDVMISTPVDPGDGCNISAVNALNSAIVSGAGNIQVAAGVDTAKLLKAIIANESDGRIDIGSSDGRSAGPFQLTTEVATQKAVECGVPAGTTINFAWLRNANTVSAQACIAAKYIQSLVSACGADIRQLAAGYNGGGGGACGVSGNCGPSAGSGQCTVYPNQNRPTRRWECLWDDNAHQVCNSTRVVAGQPATLAYTRFYAPRVEFCYNKF